MVVVLYSIPHKNQTQPEGSLESFRGYWVSNRGEHLDIRDNGSANIILEEPVHNSYSVSGNARFIINEEFGILDVVIDTTKSEDFLEKFLTSLHYGEVAEELIIYRWPYSASGNNVVYKRINQQGLTKG